MNYFFADDMGPIASGQALTGFRVLSGYKPGLSIAWVRGGLFPDLPDDLPAEVAEQLGPAFAINFNTQGVSTIGPKFAPDETRFQIASDFHFRIQQLIQSGQLDASSPAIVEALRTLRNYIEFAEAFSGAAPVLRETPAAGLEASVLEALKLSLN